MRDAAMMGRAEELKAILDEGTVAVDAFRDSTNDKDLNWPPALVQAAIHWQQECVEILLKAGADPRAKTNVRVGES